MRRAGGLVLILLLLGAAFALGLFLTRSGGLAGSSTHQVARHAPADPIVEVREELAGNYYRELGPEVLAEKTIPELLEALGDPNTEYLSAAQYTSLKNRTARS
jgi:C-terminal processing protease CtpA/Prc